MEKFREWLQIECEKKSYDVAEVIDDTLTVGELKSILSDYPDNMPIITKSNDAYGRLWHGFIKSKGDYVESYDNE